MRSIPSPPDQGEPTGRAERNIAERHERWAKRLPRDADELRSFLADLDSAALLDLLAHCASLTINAVRQPWARRPLAYAHADALARALTLDMTGYWTASAVIYVGRVTKARILEAVQEGVLAEAAAGIASLKKQPMIAAAEQLLAGTGWLPMIVRTTTGAALEVLHQTAFAEAAE